MKPELDLFLLTNTANTIFEANLELYNMDFRFRAEIPLLLISNKIKIFDSGWRKVTHKFFVTALVTEKNRHRRGEFFLLLKSRDKSIYIYIEKYIYIYVYLLLVSGYIFISIFMYLLSTFLLFRVSFLLSAFSGKKE